jgi:hypothetical protein
VGTALDLDLWGYRLQVRAAVPEAFEALSDALGSHKIPDAAPLGFVVKAPEEPNGLHSLIDRSGLVLARSRSWKDCVAVLAEHLTTFAPPPEGAVRTTMRAVIREGRFEPTAALCGFPLLSLPPLVERQLERRGQRVLDRLAVDMTLEGQLMLAPLPWSELRTAEPTGHCGGDRSGARVDAVLVPASVGVDLRGYQLVALIASTITNLDACETLDVAERLVDIARAVPINDVSARRQALAT